MNKQRKYSASALCIIILLILSLVSLIFEALVYPSASLLNSSDLMGFYIASILLILLNFITLIGVIRRTRWGLVLAIVIGIIDIISLVLMGDQTLVFSNLTNLLFDFALMFLSINILKRIN